MKPLSKIIAVLLGAAAVAGGIFGFFRMEGTSPTLEIHNLPDAAGSPREIVLVASDADSGLRRIRMTIAAGGEEKVLEDRAFPSANPFDDGAVHRETLTIALDPKQLQLPDGEAVVRIAARDYAWRNWWNGNLSEIEKTIRIDTKTPRVSVLTEQHNITQGGAGLVVYRLSEACENTGVRVGDTFYPGHPAESLLGASDEPRYLCLFALDFRQGTETPMNVEATDAAGNVGRAGFYHHIRPKNFPTDDIRISDGFLQRKLPEFQDEFDALDADIPTEPVERFLVVNRTLRKKNGDTLRNVTRKSGAEKHWSGSFVRLPNSARRSSFADHRRYYYGDHEIDRQVHMGVDLASVSQAPIPAANAGRVAFVGDVGIYGGTVIIDHGFGLFSTYSHLSRFAVETGQSVERGDIIGNTGATGLAGGDHLHFGMMVHTTFVNPVEWWDPHWIQDNILSKIEAVQGR